jgi:hypothetical protein
MGERIVMYRADDGAVFDTEAGMLAHEASLDAGRIDRWVDAVGNWSRGEAARARRLVADFLAFERTGVVPPAGLFAHPTGDAPGDGAEVEGGGTLGG